jgi:hypothetical protein
MTPEDTFRARRRQELQDLFANFDLDLSGARNPDNVLRALALCKQGFYSEEIAKIIGISPKAVQKIYRRYSFPRLHNFAPRIREEKTSWKGGVKYMKGYKYLVTPGHPYGTKHGNYVAEHRLVMEKKLGRYLTQKEVVDHIDGDITNNHPDNLRVFESNGEHLAETLKNKIPNWTADGIKKQKRFRNGYDPRRSGYSEEQTREMLGTCD